jgi:hypothetical protein
MGCFLAAFRLPVTPLTVLAVLFAQTSGRMVPFAPASLGAGVVVLAATFGTAAHTTVSTRHLAAFLVGTTVTLTVVGAIVAGAVVLRATDWRSLVRRRTWRAPSLPAES